MKAFRALLFISLVATPPVVLGTSVMAGDIERACMRSDRPASRALCGCIQDAADLTLTTKDQRRAAGFFADPHQAQVVRQSSRRADEVFWDRYKQFGEAAESFCRG